MSIRLIFAALLSAVVLLPGCAGNPATGGSSVVVSSQGREVTIGEEMHQQMIADGAAYDDPELQAYVDRIGQRLVANSDKPEMAFTFTVLDSPDINAFALPGGFIYVNRGLLAYLDSEDELAGIVTIGAYYDVEHLSEFTATGGVAAYGSKQPTAHDAGKQVEGRWVFLASAGRWLPDERDAEVFAAGAEAWKEGNAPSWDEVRPRLSPEGRNLLDYMTLTDPQAHEEARANLAPGVQEAFEKLTLRGKLGSLKAPVVLIHGRHDARIPFQESMLLREEVASNANVRLAILDAFVHAERAYGWSKFWRVAGDGVKLSRCGFEILRWTV